MEGISMKSSQRLSTSDFGSSNRVESLGNHRNNRFVRVKPHSRVRNKTIDQSSNRTMELNKSVDALNMRKGAHSFGLSFYKPPNNDYLWEKTPQYKISRAKIGRYLEQHANSLKHVPCPTKYSKLPEWGSQRMGHFRKGKRVTMSQYYIQNANKTPACNQYKTERKHKIKGNYKSTLNKTSVFDSVQEDKRSIPAPSKYQLKMNLIQKRSPITKFQKEHGKITRMGKISKDAKPGPGSYDTQSSIEKTQWKPPKGVTMKIINGASRYLDMMVKNKKNVPGVGNYKNYEKAFDITVRSHKRGKY